METAITQDAPQPDPDEALRQLSERLSHLRAAGRVAVGALARRAGLSRTTVSKALNGASVPTEDTVIALASALKTDSQPLLRLRRHALPPTSEKAASQRKKRIEITRKISKEEARFEERYLQYIEKRWENLSIIGIDLNHPGRPSWPLDLAYLSLSLGDAHETAEKIHPRASTQRPPNSIRVEQALIDRRRILVRGLAGCGKTTLLQWLAVTAARHSFPDEISHLNDCVPFFLRLRTLSRIGRLPTPSAYLQAVGCHLADDQPNGWVQRILTEGRGLILIDGVDEVAQNLRKDTRDWLQELLASYPDNQYLVTTRPSAVREGWLGDSNFSELTIHPMGPRDVAAFVDRWHQAASADFGSEHDRTHFDVLRENLKDTIRSQRGLAQITTSPLLSALVCALHTARNGHLPHGRMEIYEAALSMMLDRRDREREIEVSAVRLSERQAQRLLQRLAYWMTDNGQSEISRDDAIHHLTDVLPNLPAVAAQGTAEEIVNHLVDRSGLLRAPDDDSIDFVHRTFQDYLAARFAMEGRNFGSLVSHAHDDRWEDVIRMAVAHASPLDAQQLLHRLITRGDRFTADADKRRRLHLLAAACLDYAAELDPKIRQEVRSRAESVIPPRTRGEATDLARVGPVILDLLPGPTGLEDEEAEAVVHTAGLLGGDPAMTLLKQYRTCTKGEVPYYLQLHWSRHNIADYAREILCHNPAIDHLTINTPEQMVELRRLELPKSISFEGDFSADQISALPNARQVESLTIGYNSNLTDLESLQHYSSLQRFTLDICRGIKNVSALNQTSTQSLSVWKTSPEHLKGFRALVNLQEFRINSDCRSLELCEFFPNSEVISAYLGPMSCGSLRGLSQWPTISNLSIATHRPVDGLAEFAELPNLTSLSLSGPYVPILLHKVPVTESVTSLTLQEAEFIDFNLVIEKFPRVQKLNLHTRGDVLDISELSNVEGLIVNTYGAERA
uniref:NACHT domain-containing protein n=1 Tax=Streptomyces sp. NBC_01401 TaxID=2903854 RepID=A0AAU3H698_9ACTN